jgi:prolyl-tRNA synthetase
MRGVPLRIEVGPKDVANGTVALARRDIPGKDGKTFVPQAGIAATVAAMLTTIQQVLFDRAKAFRDSNTFEPANYEEFKAVVEKGFAHSYWCGERECEGQIKEETKATTRCIPFEQPAESGVCIHCGKPAREKAIFGKAY